MFQDHLSNQENILQSTRGLHYVFQAIFLGIGFAILAIGYSISFSIDDVSDLKVYQVNVTFALVISNIIISICGIKLLRDYSRKLYTRGVVIDVLQHLRILKYKDSLDKFLNQLFSEYSEDYLFVITKIVERITSNFGKKFKDVGSAAASDRLLAKELQDLAQFKFFDLLVFVTFFNDIYNTEYVRKDFSYQKEFSREINETRSGHYKLFHGIWFLNIILLLLLLVINLR